jgi:hypothetical protein
VTELTRLERHREDRTLQLATLGKLISHPAGYSLLCPVLVCDIVIMAQMRIIGLVAVTMLTRTWFEHAPLVMMASATVWQWSILSILNFECHRATSMKVLAVIVITIDTSMEVAVKPLFWDF